MRWGIALVGILLAGWLGLANPSLHDFHQQVAIPAADQAAQLQQQHDPGALLLRIIPQVGPALATASTDQWRDGFLAYVDAHSSRSNLGLFSLFLFCNESEQGKTGQGVRYLGIGGKVFRLSSVDCQP